MSYKVWEIASCIRCRGSASAYVIVGLYVYVVYDVVCQCRIRCRWYVYPTYNVVCLLQHRILHVIYSKHTISFISYDIVCPNTRSGPAVGTIQPAPPTRVNVALAFPMRRLLLLCRSVSRNGPEGMKHTLILLLTPRTAMATWEKDSPYANKIVRNPSQGVREPSSTDFHAPQ